MSRGKQALFTVAAVLAAIAIVAGPVTARTGSGPVAATDDLAPAAVTNLDAVPGATGIELTWELSVSDFVRQSPVGTDFTSGGTFVKTNDVAAYNVYRIVGEARELLESLDPGATTYTDELPVSGTTYIVAAADAAGNEADSDETLPVSLGSEPTMAVTLPADPGLFGDVLVGTIGEQSFLVENTETIADASLTAIVSVTGAGFSTSATRITLDPEGSTTFEVFFTPVDVGDINGSYSGSLTIRSNDPKASGRVEVPLSAVISTGIDVPDIDVSPATIQFSRWRLVNTTGTRTLTLSNLGGQPLTGNIVLTQPSAGDVFAISGSTTINRAAGTTREIVVNFTPTAANVFYTGSIRLTTNDPDEPVKIVPLTGKGVSELPTVGKVKTRVHRARVTFNTVIDLEDDVVVEDFIARFKAALAKELGISPSRIKNIVLREGSVIVDFDIAKTSDPAAGEPTAEEAVADLNTILSDPAVVNDITDIAPVTAVSDQSADVEFTPEDVDGNPVLGWFTREGTRVGLDDFFLFAEYFGLDDTEDGFDATFDIEPVDEPDGQIGLDDFFLFAEDFGKTIVNAEEIQDALN